MRDIKYLVKTISAPPHPALFDHPSLTLLYKVKSEVEFGYG